MISMCKFGIMLFMSACHGHELSCFTWFGFMFALVHMFGPIMAGRMPKASSPEEAELRKTVKRCVKQLMESESNFDGLNLKDIRSLVKDKVLEGEPEDEILFNAIVDSTVSHLQRKKIEEASSSKRKGVLKPIFMKK